MPAYRNRKKTSRDLVKDLDLPTRCREDEKFVSRAAAYLDQLRENARLGDAFSDHSLGAMVEDFAWDIYNVLVNGPSPEGFSIPYRTLQPKPQTPYLELTIPELAARLQKIIDSAQYSLGQPFVPFQRRALQLRAMLEAAEDFE